MKNVSKTVVHINLKIVLLLLLNFFLYLVIQKQIKESIPSINQ